MSCDVRARVRLTPVRGQMSEIVARASRSGNVYANGAAATNLRTYLASESQEPVMKVKLLAIALLLFAMLLNAGARAFEQRKPAMLRYAATAILRTIHEPPPCVGRAASAASEAKPRGGGRRDT